MKKPMQPSDIIITDTWWLTHDGIRQVFKTIEQADGDIRFIGGCVRDAIINRKTHDIDCATSLTPEQVIDAMRDAGVKVIPTGIDHGTVTVVLNDGKQIEVTTLRRDVETHGRHARVAYTDDWKTDAARRDFTMNAMSCDLSGQVYDPFGGASDIKQGNIIFIGNPVTRIQEDFLRILRFFRFYARFGQGDINADGLQAAIQFAPQMAKLSGERIRDELFKLMIATACVDAMTIMLENGILEPVLPYLSNLHRFKSMIEAEESTDMGADVIRRLAAICGDGEEAIQHTATRLRLSNDQTARLRAMKIYPGKGSWPDIGPDIGPDRGLDKGLNKVRELIYRHGRKMVADQYCYQLAARTGKTQIDEDIVSVIKNWTPPEFPLTGHDVMEGGVPAGPKIGKILRQVEDWWIDQDFEPDRTDCLEKLQHVLS